ncbi:hypothetical protein QUF64_12255 [Anaerolineales bacterium HSG6]|nr:hypothetical protein [Anaerolineales bacterium HSG6]
MTTIILDVPDELAKKLKRFEPAILVEVLKKVLEVLELLAPAQHEPETTQTSWPENLNIPQTRLDEEQALLAVINHQLPPKQQARLLSLREKSQVMPLDGIEQTELLQFVGQVEQQDGERTKALITLAQKRGVSMIQLMDELGIEATYA